MRPNYIRLKDFPVELPDGYELTYRAGAWRMEPIVRDPGNETAGTRWRYDESADKWVVVTQEESDVHYDLTYDEAANLWTRVRCEAPETAFCIQTRTRHWGDYGDGPHYWIDVTDLALARRLGLALPTPWPGTEDTRPGTLESRDGQTGVEP